MEVPEDEDELEDVDQPQVKPMPYADHEGGFDYNDEEAPYHLNFGVLPDNVQQRVDQMAAKFSASSPLGIISESG